MKTPLLYALILVDANPRVRFWIVGTSSNFRFLQKQSHDEDTLQ